MGYRFRKFARRNRPLLVSGATVLAVLLLGLGGTSWALVESIKSEARAVGELRRRELETRRMRNASLVQNFQAGKILRFDETTCELLDRMSAQISRDPRFNTPELQALRRDTLTELVRFWDQVIASERDRTGNPGSRLDYYRLQRAVCLARLGEHKQAFSEGRAIADADAVRARQWAHTFARLCSLCSAAVINEPDMREFYVEEGIAHLRQASRSEKHSPPSPGDPDLAGLSSHKDFQALLAEWLQTWKQTERQVN